MKYAIGFDIGGTRIKAGAVDADGSILQGEVAPTEAGTGPLLLVERLTEIVDGIAGALGERPNGIGLGLSGAVDPAVGTVYLPGKFKGLEGFPLVPVLAERTGVTVTADNDARLVLLAERKFGLGRGIDWLVSITIGTGLGSGVVLDGKILRDPHLQFGTQLGHLVIQSDGGKLCLTNACGTGESLCSATALAMSVRDGLQRGIPSVLTERYHADPSAVDFSAVIEGLEKDDRLCVFCFEQWRARLGWVLVNAVHAYAPELIVIGGGGAHAAPHFLDWLRRHVNDHIFRYPPDKPVAIEASKLMEEAGILGAAAVAWERRGQDK